MRWAWIDVDAQALRQNVGTLRSRSAPSDVMAVVKANAYGHGSVWTAWHALAAGAAWLGVATPQEALELRQAGLAAPILVLSATTREDVSELADRQVSVTILSEEWIPLLGSAARHASRPLAVHLKVDTGMGRVGVHPSRLGTAVQRIREQEPSLHLEGLMTHLARSDDDPAYTELQLSRFRQALAQIPEKPRWIHALNSGGIFAVEFLEGNLTRSGIALYGLSPSGRNPAPEGTRPVMALRARAVHIKTVRTGESVGYGRTWIASEETVVVTLPLGYADGYPRALSNKAQVLFQGQRWPVIGRVSMDQLTVGLPKEYAVALGDVFTLIGRDGQDAISADEVGGWAGTIGYEVVAGLSRRLPRRDAQTGETFL